MNTLSLLEFIKSSSIPCMCLDSVIQNQLLFQPSPNFYLKKLVNEAFLNVLMTFLSGSRFIPGSLNHICLKFAFHNFTLIP